MLTGGLVFVSLFCDWNDSYLLLSDSTFYFVRLVVFCVCEFKEGNLIFRLMGKSMIFMTKYFKVMNSLPVANISLDTQLLLLCFDSSFRFVYQCHGLFCFLLVVFFFIYRKKLRKKLTLSYFTLLATKPFFLWCLGNPGKLEGSSVCVSASQCVSECSWRLESHSVSFSVAIPGHGWDVAVLAV